MRDAQIDEIKACTGENRRQSQALTSWADEYMVVINATHHDVTLNRALVNNITQYTAMERDPTHLIMTLKDQMHQLEVARR